MDYKQKYLKYKSKYLESKQKGGEHDDAQGENKCNNDCVMYFKIIDSSGNNVNEPYSDELTFNNVSFKVTFERFKLFLTKYNKTISDKINFDPENPELPIILYIKFVENPNGEIITISDDSEEKILSAISNTN